MSRNCFAPAVALVTLLSACSATALEPSTRSSALRSAIEWTEVPALLKSGRVAVIVQLHDLTVTLTTNEGLKFVTREPAIDAILSAIALHAPNAKSIVVATE